MDFDVPCRISLDYTFSYSKNYSRNTVQSIVLFLFVFPVVRRELYARRSRYAGQTSDASIVPVDSDGIGIDGIRV